MKKMLAIGLGLCLMGFLVRAADEDKTPAVEEKKPATPPATKNKVLEKYDKNHDGKLDDAERAELQKDREAARKERQAEMLKKYDKNGDGKLDDTERAAAREEYRLKQQAAAEKKAAAEPKKDAPEPKKDTPK